MLDAVQLHEFSHFQGITIAVERAHAMASHIVEMSQRKIALVAGIAFLVMTIAAAFAIFFVFENIKVPGDALATTRNIIASKMLFRAGICGLVVVVACDIVVAWSLYLILEPANKGLSLLAAIFRLIYAAILGSALFNLVIALRYATDQVFVTSLGTNPLQLQASTFVNAFFDSWSIGLLIFGFHLLVLGYLIFKSKYIPPIFGTLLIFGSVGYFVQNFAVLLLPGYENYKPTFDMVLSLPMAIGELSLAFWLLFKGGKRLPGNNRAPASP